MATECTEAELFFQGPARRTIRAGFDGGNITQDGGVLLLQAADERTEIIE